MAIYHHLHGNVGLARMIVLPGSDLDGCWAPLCGTAASAWDVPLLPDPIPVASGARKEGAPLAGVGLMLEAVLTFSCAICARIAARYLAAFACRGSISVRSKPAQTK